MLTFPFVVAAIVSALQADPELGDNVEIWDALPGDPNEWPQDMIAVGDITEGTFEDPRVRAGIKRYDEVYPLDILCMSRRDGDGQAVPDLQAATSAGRVLEAVQSLVVNEACVRRVMLSGYSTERGLSPTGLGRATAVTITVTVTAEAVTP